MKDCFPIYAVITVLPETKKNQTKISEDNKNKNKNYRPVLILMDIDENIFNNNTNSKLNPFYIQKDYIV